MYFYHLTFPVMKQMIAYAAVAATLLFGSTHAVAQKQRKANPHEPGEDIYKHYTGTIGTKKITMDLRWGYQGGSNYGGSTYYTPGDDKVTRLIIGEPESFDHGVPMIGHEDAEDNSLTEKPGNWDHSARWNFTISGNKITGKWSSADGGQQLDINLTEDYSNAIPLDLKVAEYSSVQKVEGSDKPLAQTTAIYVTPTAQVENANKLMVERAIYELTGIGAGRVANFSELPRLYNNAYAAEVSRLNKTTTEHEKIGFFMPVYNDNGFLVLEKDEMDLTGRKNAYAYQYIDVKYQRAYQSFEILAPDRPVLTPLLTAEFRKKYHLPTNKALSTWLRTDDLPVPETFYPMQKGIMFVYSAGDILKDTDEGRSTFNRKISLYLPYTQISSILGQDFKARMGIN